MTKTIKQAVADHRQRKNDFADEICKAHDLPAMTWDGLGTWAIKNKITVELYFLRDGYKYPNLDRVDGNNYARKQG